MNLVHQPIGYDYTGVTETLLHIQPATAGQVADDLTLTINHTRLLLNCAEADGMVERLPYAGKNRADLWRLA